MTKVYNNRNVFYGLNQPLPVGSPEPIIAVRAPTANDSAQVGTTWVDTVDNSVYTLTSVQNGTPTWTNTAGAGEIVASITATNGPNSLTGTTNINTTGAAVTTIGTGGTGAVRIGNATGNTAVTGGLSTTTTLSSGTTFTAGTGITSTAGNIVAAAGNISATAGSVSAGTTVTAGTGITATTGNITASTGNFIATIGGFQANGGNIVATAGDVRAGGDFELLGAGGALIFLAGPTIVAGAGAPVGAAPIGSLYLNATPTGATDRAFINTDGATTWTNITTAA